MIVALASWAGAADRVFLDARVWTGDEARPWATALAVEDGVWTYVGDADGVVPFLAGAVVERLGGATLVPGFVDGHVHLLEGGLEAQGCDLVEAPDADAIAARVRTCAEGHGWLVGSGWALPAFPGGSPTADALDALVPDRPAVLFAADGHSAWLNHAGLRRVGLDRGVDPPEGVVVRDAEGRPTGTVREGAVDRVAARLPDPSAAQRRRALLDAQDRALAVGLVGVVEANVDRAGLRTWSRLARRGKLVLRASLALETDPLAGAAQVRGLVALRHRFEQPGLRVATAKLFLDGVLESRTASMLDPYADTGTVVPPSWAPEVLDATLRALVEANFDVHLHVVGDAAVRLGLDAVTHAGPAAVGRVAMAHLEVVDPADLPRFEALGVTAVVQPLWAWPDAYVRDLTLGGVSAEVGARLYPIRSLSSAALAFGSDWSVSSLDPLDGIEVAVTRRDPDGIVLEPLAADQAVDLDVALRAATAGAARSGRLGPGVITVGAPADAVALSADPFAVAPTALSEIEVRRVSIGGVERWRAQEDGLPWRSPSSSTR